ncbi:MULTISPECIES: gluconokinase [Heyndrickxia]|uniref:gluconokinase n=1 Tax=Heyndrickxia TaxID=2837504 RepID=UPI0030F7E56C
MAQSYMMGVDIGTTSTKAVLFTKEGEVVDTFSKGYPLHNPTPSIAEQDPDEIFQAVIISIRELMKSSGIHKEELMFVSFSSAMHSVIAVDGQGNPLTKSITWADNRSVKYADELKASKRGLNLYRRTGTPIHPMSPITKLIWLRNEHSEVFNRTNKFLGIKEYIFYKMFHQYVMDYSLASATGMFNLETLKWDKEALEIAGIDESKLPALVPTTHILKNLDSGLAGQMNISVDTPFVVGASDGVLSNLGLNAIKPGVLAVTIGTSGAIRTVSDKPLTDPKGRTFCYALTENHWVVGGPVNNGGVTFQWARDQFGQLEVQRAEENGEDAYELLTEMAEKVAPGADGLIFHPYMAGERAPIWNADARGSFFGLALYHTRAHLVRAVLEGVMYNLYSVMLALQELIGEPKKIHASGGFVRSKLWRQIMADVFGGPVTIPESYESSCLGAVVLGLYAIGEIDRLEVVEDMVGTTNDIEPNPENAKIYEELMSIFLSISRKMEEDYHRIAQYQRKIK